MLPREATESSRAAGSFQAWCEVTHGELILKEAEDAKWLTKEHLADVEWLPADVTLIEKIREAMY